MSIIFNDCQGGVQTILKKAMVPAIGTILHYNINNYSMYSIIIYIILTYYYVYIPKQNKIN